MVCKLQLPLRQTINIKVTHPKDHMKKIPYLSNITFINRYSQAFKMRGEQHAGLIQKPLQPYHPHAYRNRLY